MNEQQHKKTSVASLFPDLAWSLLTPEQQQQLLEYLEKAHKWASIEKKWKEQEREK